MTSDVSEKIRDKDHVVLQHIKEGRDDVQKITEETTLENHHVSYSFEKMQELGLITVSKPDTMVERVVNGQKRVFQHPKQAELTEKAVEYLQSCDSEDVEQYEDMSHGELVEKVRQLENEVEEMKQTFNIFKKQVQKKIQN